MLDFLPNNIKDGLRRINFQYLYEIRLRADKPVMINYQGEYRYLGIYGVTDISQHAIVSSREDIANCIFHAGEESVYSVEEQIKQGYLTAKKGERIGVAGEYVFQDGQPLTIRNFSSICIRVPHEVVECGATIYKKCMSDKIHSILIMSRPGIGKTTILRDLSRLISRKYRKNILICDERGELSAGNLGDTCDVLKFSDKKVAFEAGIRAMRPEVIITDELSTEDCEAVKRAINAGIYVLASAHFFDYNALTPAFRGIFERYIALDDKEIGKISRIYDRDGKELI